MKKVLSSLAMTLLICACSAANLHMAVRNNDMEKVRYFVSQGANVNERYGEPKSTGYSNPAQFSGQTGGYGHTPLIVACYYGYTRIVDYLCDHGADLNAHGADGATGLIYAAEYNYNKVAQTLIEHGANVNLKDKHGFSALYYAEQNSNKELVEMLRSKGAVEE
jgi:ankyrin repeat protein